MQSMLTAIFLSAILVAGTSADANADHRRRGERWDHWEHRDYWNPRSRWERRQYQRQLRRWQRQRNRYWRNHWYYTPPRFRNHRYRRDWGWPLSHIGSAAIGSAITYSLLHDRGDHRYCDHVDDNFRRGAGCYRIETLPDGRERRVELPASACR